jgi:hypothetical protein
LWSHASWFFIACFHAIGLLVAFCIYALTERLSSLANRSALRRGRDLVFGFGYARARRDIGSADPDVKAGAVVTGFIVMTAAYLYVLSTTIELAENSRYRFEVEPLFIVLAATAITTSIRALRTSTAKVEQATPP